MNIQETQIQRLAIFRNLPKEGNQTSSTIEGAGEIIELDNDSKKVIEKRLVEVLGTNSGSFQLDIENESADSFFTITKILFSSPAESFLTYSYEIAEKLALVQKKTNIPGGYIIVLHLKVINTDLNYLIVIKAETHEALQKKPDGGLAAVQDLLLSPAQKLFKVGLLGEKPEAIGNQAKENYWAYVSDKQQANKEPSEFFYRQFLGFTTEKNHHINSQKVYEGIIQFTELNIEKYSDKVKIVEGIRNEFANTQENYLILNDFKNKYIPEDLKDPFMTFISGVVKQETIRKSDRLLKYTLKFQSLNFDEGIQLKGKEEVFSQRVQIIQNQEDLLNLNTTDSSYTIIKVLGKPYATRK